MFKKTNDGCIIAFEFIVFEKLNCVIEIYWLNIQKSKEIMFEAH